MEEEVLEALIKRAVDHCFKDNITKIIATDALRKSANLTERVQSLELSALKEMVAERRKVDVTADILFSLILKEPVDITHFTIRESCNCFTHIRPEADYQKLRNDPYVMYAVVRQHGSRYTLDLTLTRTQLIIKYSHHTIATIPNRENEIFDTFWAVRFFELCLKMRCSHVQLAIKDEWIQNVANHRSILNSVIDSVKQVTPAEGWKKAMKKGELAIYKKLDFENFVALSTYFIFVHSDASIISTPFDCYCAFQV